MYLKSIALRGFKSFADKTVLELEPGITVIVGPNGSGKSNVVDALTWVLGTSSAKSLRGGQMADVIFAGSGSTAPTHTHHLLAGEGGSSRRGRPALGRASVDITIDNADGVMPVEFSEVTVGRSMFADGDNAYAVNGVDCRMLDVQELLGHSGLGREHHTIVGQGRLDAVLGARPEERRAFVEEAAGILTHRRRKERALRKLAQMEGHLERLGDLLRELRRQRRPLERQAEAAARHADLQAALRAARTARALRELAVLTARAEGEQTGDAESLGRLGAVEAALTEARARETALEEALARLTPAARSAAEVHFRLANLLERARGLEGRVDERRAGLAAAVEEPVAGRDPEQLRAQATDERAALEALDVDLQASQAALTVASERRQAAEHARRAHEQAAAAEARRRAEARERALRWEGEVAALQSALAQAASEEGRLVSQVSGLALRTQALGADVDAVQAELHRHVETTADRADHVAQMAAAVLDREAAAAEAAQAERDLERRRASLGARAEALHAASREPGEGAAALLTAAEQDEVKGVAGPLAAHLRIEEGLAAAAAAALGPLGDALVVESRAAAEDAVRFVLDRDGGRVVLLAGQEGVASLAPTTPSVPESAGASALALALAGARPLVDGIDAAPGLHAALRLALAGVHVVDDFPTACRLADAHPDLAFVTLDGTVAGRGGYVGGMPTHRSPVVVRDAALRAETELAGVEDALVAARDRLAACDVALSETGRARAAAVAALQESEAARTGAAERLARLRRERTAGESELEVLRSQADEVDREIAAQHTRLAALEARGPGEHPDAGAPGADSGDVAGDVAAERLDDELAEAREAEVQARLASSAAAQRGAERARRAESLEREAGDVERRLAERERRRRARLVAIGRCDALRTVAGAAVIRAETSLGLATAERDRVEEERGGSQRDLGALRARSRDLESERTDLVARRHVEDLRRAELRHALDAVRARMTDELALDPDRALAQAAEEPEGPLADLEDADADRRLAEEEERLVRRVGLLGRVNPLAREEFEALQEREHFLADQLEDLRASRRDLLQVVEAVDGRIREVFGAAFADVADHFEKLFPRLFPGGEGHLVLTDPDDLLNTGIEVEARPAGKRVKRLSLLSGGERSLTALAVLFAIFAARPSPFYVLDEVEAALDDVNLQRFLDVLADFRGTSQLLVVTHQRRTMEIADTLYGVSMRNDGVSRVVAQRMDAALAGQPRW